MGPPKRRSSRPTPLRSRPAICCGTRSTASYNPKIASRLSYMAARKRIRRATLVAHIAGAGDARPTAELTLTADPGAARSNAIGFLHRLHDPDQVLLAVFEPRRFEGSAIRSEFLR